MLVHHMLVNQRWMWMRGRVVLIVTLALVAGVASAQAAEPNTETAKPAAGRVLSVLRDFEQDRRGDLAPIKHHTWSAEQQQNASQFSQVQIVPHPEFGEQACQLTIGEKFPWGNRAEYRALTIGPDYFSPETDAIRLRVKVVRGKFTLSLGSPTVYFGHSDVSTRTHTVSAGKTPAWQTVEFSLHEGLRRNTRRARFGEKSPVIHYTRWIQEPLYLYVGPPSAGELLLDQVEAVAHGQGRPYPQFTPEQVQRVATIADFEKPADLDQAFTFFQEPIDLTKAPYAPRPDWKPPKLERVEQGQAGKFSLRIEQQGTEEVAFAGIKAMGTAEANALQLTVRGEHASPLAEIALDFVVYVAPPKLREAFPWGDFQPPESWRKDPLAFTYYLGQQQTRQANYGFYHLRRTVPNGKWTSLVLPCADFVCAYGQQGCAAMFEQQLPLQADSIMALGFVSPYRQRQGVTRLLIDDLTWVRVPGEAAALRSFWQPPLARPRATE